MDDCSADYIVIGVGIIGLSTAWRLAKKGASVIVLEQGEVAHGASWAAAGMLSPFGENHSEGPLLKFGVDSLKLYPQFLAELADDGAKPPKLQPPGMIRLVMDESDLADRKHSVTMAASHGFPSEWLDRQSVLDLEPNVSQSVLGGVLSPKEVHLSPRLLCSAIAKAAKNLGVKIIDNCKVISGNLIDEKLVSIGTLSASYTAGFYILTAGAWSSEFGTFVNEDIPVFPRKGQVVMVEMESKAALFRHSLYLHNTYLVPRGSQMLIGATQENVGFDSSITQAATESLLENACAVVPKLSGSKLVDSWTGFRPATPDSLPIIGWSPKYNNLYYSTGHLRNGILLAPITAMSTVIELTTSQRVVPTEFSPKRFSKSS